MIALAAAGAGLALAGLALGFGLGRLSVRRELLATLARYARLRDPPMSADEGDLADELEDYPSLPVAELRSASGNERKVRGFLF